MADIFISYSRKDVDCVRPLVERFEAEGWTVFWDRKIPPGKQWPDVLDAELTPASCVLVLWSKNSVGSRWVIEEAEVGVEKKALLAARLDTVKLPVGFKTVQACDLTDREGAADASALGELIDEIGKTLGKRKGVSIKPLELVVVLGRPKRHLNLGATVNLTCRFFNQLERVAEVHGLIASATGPGEVSYDFDWQLVYDVVAGGAEHLRRIQTESKLRIPAGKPFETGVQLRAPILADVVAWPVGTYKFKLRGWVNSRRHESLPNLKCDFDATLDGQAVEEIEKHLNLSDEGWKIRRYSDDAYGVPFFLSNVRPGLPAV